MEPNTNMAQSKVLVELLLIREGGLLEEKNFDPHIF
jgi:hypothetical protein